MKKIEALTLELAYSDAASIFNCSITELAIEVVQVPSSGFLGFFKKTAIIVATKRKVVTEEKEIISPKPSKPLKKEPKIEELKVVKEPKVVKKPEVKQSKTEKHITVNDTIMPASFVNDQDEEDEYLTSGLAYTADYDDEYDETEKTQLSSELSKLTMKKSQTKFRIKTKTKKSADVSVDIQSIAKEVEEKINKLFKHTCFYIEKIEVSMYDSETLSMEFKGNDVALLIGKEGYRYKALSYMLFNWINSTYKLQLRLEIAEFLKNQEESMDRYLESVCENVARDGKAQTKTLDGVLLQIALKELREKYPEKYVVIRSTRDGLKYVLVAEYHN